MSIMSKQPFNVIEIPINKFYEEAIPHHKLIYENHKVTSHKLFSAGLVTQLNKEVNNKKHIVKQLKDLLYELDTLRTQVEDIDLDKFDNQTFSLRKTIALLIKDYNAIAKQAMILSGTENNINENIENERPLKKEISEIHMEKSLSEIKLREQQDILNNVIDLETDIKDIQGIYAGLNQMVGEQGEHVNQIESNIEETEENTNAGLKHLVLASRLSKATYPLTGALIGSFIGGPVGMVAGFKIGGAAAIGCGIAGYASGKFLKNCTETEEGDNVINEAQVESQANLGCSESSSTAKNENEKKEK